MCPPNTQSSGRAPPRSSVSRNGRFFAATSLTFLKSCFKRTWKPLIARLARLGATANQVTIASLVASLVVGILVTMHADDRVYFGFLPVWLVLRMGLATIDGTLATDFGQKSRLGGILNEARRRAVRRRIDLAIRIRAALRTGRDRSCDRTRGPLRTCGNCRTGAGGLTADRWPVREDGPQLGLRRARHLDRGRRNSPRAGSRAPARLRAPVGRDHRQSSAICGRGGQSRRFEGNNRSASSAGACCSTLISDGSEHEEPSNDASDQRTAMQGAWQEGLQHGTRHPREATLRRSCQGSGDDLCRATCARWVGLVLGTRQRRPGTHAADRRGLPSWENLRHSHYLKQLDCELPI
jgi:hypothetical protein